MSIELIKGEFPTNSCKGKRVDVNVSKGGAVQVQYKDGGIMNIINLETGKNNVLEVSYGMEFKLVPTSFKGFKFKSGHTDIIKVTNTTEIFKTDFIFEKIDNTEVKPNSNIENLTTPEYIDINNKDVKELFKRLDTFLKANNF